MCSSPHPGPQSPCERTDLRMAIVADHLGLSWTGKKKSRECPHLEDICRNYFCSGSMPFYFS
uniref:Uncharacterized protein n=1 Tax=Anguilla anguilla TaxID=7936 RepID=A0A0E9PB41_ANGAN